MDARGKFGEHVREALELLEAQPRATVASWVLSNFPSASITRYTHT